MDALAEGLWGLADHHENKGEIGKAVKCLEAICQSQVSFLPIVEIKTRLRIATLLLKHTNNVDHAKSHLERSQLLLKSIPSCFELKCRAYSLLSQCYHLVGAIPPQKQILNKGLDLTASSGDGFAVKLWSCNFNSQLANALIIEGDYQNSISALDRGYECATEICYPELQMFFSTSILHVHLMQWDDVNSVERAVEKCDEVWECIHPDKLRICDYKNATQHVDKLDAAMKGELEQVQRVQELTAELKTINLSLSRSGLHHKERSALCQKQAQLQEQLSHVTRFSSTGKVSLEPSYFGNARRAWEDKLALAPPPIDGEWLPKSAVYALVDLMVVMFGRPKGSFKECGRRIQSGLHAIHGWFLRASEELLQLGITDGVTEEDLQLSAIWMAGVYLMILMQFLENKIAIALTRSEFVEAQEVSTFIYNHGHALQMLREKCGGDLVRPGITRFATNYIALKSFEAKKPRLRAMFASTEWFAWRGSDTPAGRAARETINSEGFWHDVKKVVTLLEPLVKVLRMVDSEKKPTLPHLYAAIDMMKRHVHAAIPRGGKRYLEIIQTRWEKMLMHPMHKAAYYLNPKYQYKCKLGLVQELVDAVQVVVEKLEPNSRMQSKCNQEALVQMKNWLISFPKILQGCESIFEMLRGQYAHSLGCFSEAAFHFTEAAKLTESKSMQAMCQVYAAISYICIGDAESSSQALDLIGPVYRTMDSFVGVREKTAVLLAYGLLLMKQHNLQEARIRLASGLRITHQHLGNIQLVSQYLTILGSLALALHDTGQATEILKSSLTLAKTLYDVPTQIWVLSVMTALYQELGEKGNEMSNSEYERKKSDDLQKRLADAQSSIHHIDLIDKVKVHVRKSLELDNKRATTAGSSMRFNLDIPESVGLTAPSPARSSPRLKDMDIGRRGKRRI